MRGFYTDNKPLIAAIRCYGTVSKVKPVQAR